MAWYMLKENNYSSYMNKGVHDIFTTGRNIYMDVYLSKMPVLDVFMTANSILLSNIYPAKHFCQIYIHCISAGCKNAMYPNLTLQGTPLKPLT